MSYVVSLLKAKKEEYETLLDVVDRHLEAGNVFRTAYEKDIAQKSKANYETVLADINEKLSLIPADYKQGLSWKEVFDGQKRLAQDMFGAAGRAVDAGYEYLAWNGWVYKLDANPIAAKKTDILVENLK